MLDIKQENPLKLHLSLEAFELWKNFSYYIEKEVRPGGKFESVPDWAGKLAGNILRICGLFHCVIYADYESNLMSSSDFNIISPELMERVISFSAFLEDHALAAFGLLREDIITTKAKKIIEWYKNKNIKKFTARECFSDLRRRFKNTEEVIASLKVLVERRFITTIKSKTMSGQNQINYLIVK
jgi:hypothetical protein